MKDFWAVYDKLDNAVYQGNRMECDEWIKTNKEDGFYVDLLRREKNYHQSPQASVKMDASAILIEAAETIKNRAAERDVEKERSMATAVKLFSEITANDLTEYEGWMFMACLKLARNREGTMSFNRDHLLDCMAYLALALESKQ